MEQVVDLVELDLDLLEPLDVRAVEAAAVAGLGVERLLLVGEGVDPIEQVGVAGHRPPYLVRGKPRSTFEVPGSGQREVTTFARV